LARFIGMRSPAHVAWCAEIRATPFKKTAKTGIGYLEKAEMDALLAQPDRHAALGDRDHALLLFLYNSGARADEAATLTIDRLQLGAQSSVRLHGKGNKFRTCPLWPVTATSLSRLIANRGKDEPVFLNRSNQPLTRFGIHRLVGQYAEQASRTVPSMATKQVSPHTIRHTTAVHLLRAGVDINTIRAWLGHVSLDTTHIYAEVDMEMKAKALASVDISSLQTRPWQRPVLSLAAPHNPGRNITAIGVTVRMDRPILVPQHQQVDGGTLELQHQRRPVGLGVEPRPAAHPGIDEQSRHQALVGDVRGQRPTDPRRRRSSQVFPHRARGDAQLPPDRPRACPGTEVQRQQLPYPPHGKPRCRHPAPPSIAMAALEARSLLTRETIHPPPAPLSGGWAASSEWWAA
jgi:integrase/recombinase XerD